LGFYIPQDFLNGKLHCADFPSEHNKYRKSKSYSKPSINIVFFKGVPNIRMKINLKFYWRNAENVIICICQTSDVAQEKYHCHFKSQIRFSFCLCVRVTSLVCFIQHVQESKHSAQLQSPDMFLPLPSALLASQTAPNRRSHCQCCSVAVLILLTCVVLYSLILLFMT
jgi:hypothetical protein